MKHDFNRPNVQTIPHFTGMPCDCVECVKNAAYTKQLNDRNAVYVNSFDFPDFDRLNVTARDLVNHADSPPVISSPKPGDWVYSSKDQPIYRKAGQPAITTRKAGKALGHFKGLNTGGNWIISNDSVYGEIWISYTHPGDFYFKPADTSASISLADKIKLAADVGSVAVPGTGTILAPVVSKGADVVVAAGDILGSLSGYVKWILILVVLVVLAGLYFRIKG